MLEAQAVPPAVISVLLARVHQPIVEAVLETV